MQRSWNERQWIAAQRAWEASAVDGLDHETRKALQRLSATYFWASVGMDRAAEPKLNAAPGEERPPYLRAGESPRRI